MLKLLEYCYLIFCPLSSLQNGVQLYGGGAYMTQWHHGSQCLQLVHSLGIFLASDTLGNGLWNTWPGFSYPWRNPSSSWLALASPWFSYVKRTWDFCNSISWVSWEREYGNVWDPHHSTQEQRGLEKQAMSLKFPWMWLCPSWEAIFPECCRFLIPSIL